MPYPILGLSNQTAPCPLVPTECVSASYAEWQAYYKPLQSLVSKLPWDDELSVRHTALKPSTNGSEGQLIMNPKYGIRAHLHKAWSYPPYHSYYLLRNERKEKIYLKSCPVTIANAWMEQNRALKKLLCITCILLKKRTQQIQQPSNLMTRLSATTYIILYYKTKPQNILANIKHNYK